MTNLEPGEDSIADVPGMVRQPSITDLPTGYIFGVTRYADVIFREVFPKLFEDLISVLSDYRIEVNELIAGGGGRASHTARFDAGLEARGWGKRNISIAKTIDDRQLFSVRGHEIDMFGVENVAEPYPGIAMEMEWNNKDPFFDRDLNNFAALHREGALAVGAIITRGPTLQRFIKPAMQTSKYGSSTTHWDKLIPRINLGGGGECPLLLIGIEPERIDGFDRVLDAVNRGQRLS